MVTRAIGALAPIARCPPPGSVFGGPKGGTACVGAGCNKSQVGTGSGVLSRGARRPVNRPFFFSFCFLGLRVCALWHTNATCRRGANSHKAEMTKRHRNKKTLTTSREGSQSRRDTHEETPTSGSKTTTKSRGWLLGSVCVVVGRCDCHVSGAWFDPRLKKGGCAATTSKTRTTRAGCGARVVAKQHHKQGTKKPRLVVEHGFAARIP